MRINFIEARNFQRFAQGVRVQDLGPGLNVIAGPNEEGKSTLLRAVRAALFERHRAQPLTQAYRPFGQSVEPEVRLGLRIGEVNYEVHKIFSRRVSGGNLLTSDQGGRWQNEDAETQLELLLGSSHAGRGKSSSELQGPAGLLWISQGDAFKPVSPAEEHLRLLHGTLDSSITQMLGGSQGDRLHTRITAQYEEYYDKRGLARGELRSADTVATTASEALEQARAALAQFESRTDLLAEKQRRLEEFVQDSVLELARQQRDAARARLQRLATRGQQVEEAEQRLKLANVHLQQAVTEWDARQAMVSALDTSARLRNEARAREDAAQAALDGINPGLTAARANAADAATKLDGAQHELALLARWQQLERTVQDEKQARVRLESAENAQTERRALSAERSGLTVNPKQVNEMEDLLRERDRLEARLRAGAARLDFALEPDRSAVLDGEIIRERGSVPVLSARELRIHGVGRFVLHPAASSASDCAASPDETSRRLQSLLKSVGATDADEARRMLRRKQEIERRLEILETTLDLHAPDGLEALRDIAAGLARTLSTLGEELASSQRPSGDLERLRAEQDALRISTDAARGQAANLESEVIRAREELAAAQATRAEAERHHRDSARDLNSARAASNDELLAEAVTRTREDVQRQRLELDALKATLAAENPDAAALAMEQAAETYRNRKEEMDALTRDCADLRIELRALGQQGLAEQAAQLATTHEQACRRLSAVSHRAQATKLLHELMTEALDRAKRSVAQPIVDRLGPYIETVIPGSTPIIDENLALGGLGREGSEQNFEVLSMGTREQVAVLTRLAYADALTEAGKPVCVILDDPLVNTDDERLERMQAVLFEASRRYQIVILTCHARAYHGAGGRLLQLQDCRIDPA